MVEPATTTAIEKTKYTFPHRPQVSSTFAATVAKVSLASNHYQITLSKKDSRIFQYDVKILDIINDQEILPDARIQRQGIMISASEQLKNLYGENYWWSGFVVWSTKRQDEARTVLTRFEERDYSIYLNKTKEISLGSDSFKDNTVAAPARQYINVLIKRFFREKKFVEWGMNSKFYDPENMKKAEQFYLEIYTGFKTSCEVYQNYTLKILIDFASRIVRQDSALYYINEAHSAQAAREMLQGRSVIASYGNYRMWRVDDIDYTQNPESTFQQDDQNRITYVKYFKRRYNITIKNLKQPLLRNVHRKTGKISYLVPELVQMTGLDDEMRKNFQLMTEVSKHTRLEPDKRKQEIQRVSGELNDFLTTKYDIKMDMKTPVQGYVLNAPEITIGNKSFVPERGSFQLRDSVFKPANFKKWVFVYLDECKQDATNFLRTLEECAAAFAIGVGKPTIAVVENRTENALTNALKAKVTDETMIVVCMYTPGQKKTWYKVLKDFCYKEKGVPCQAVVSTTLKKNAMSVCSKIILQMNAKIGLELWVTSRPVGLPEKTMIIGADVYHNTKIGQERKSCIGFCASLNPGFSKFYSTVRLQNKVGEEIMNGIGELVKKAVLEYFAFNGKKFLPECIIFFRDGVAENQLDAILNFETQAILQQLKSIDPGYNPKFAEIVITKRIDDRIFASGSGSHRSGRGGTEPKGVSNPPAGTVVAEGIVSNNFDYLLVAQNVNQGTCTPTKFNVIYDSTGLNQEVFWQLSYSQCYNYFNWNGSVRVPAPVQYAHKLAYLVGQTVEGNMHAKLEQSLSYL